MVSGHRSCQIATRCTSDKLPVIMLPMRSEWQQDARRSVVGYQLSKLPVPVPGNHVAYAICMATRCTSGKTRHIANMRSEAYFFLLSKRLHATSSDSLKRVNPMKTMQRPPPALVNLTHLFTLPAQWTMPGKPRSGLSTPRPCASIPLHFQFGNTLWPHTRHSHHTTGVDHAHRQP